MHNTHQFIDHTANADCCTCTFYCKTGRRVVSGDRKITDCIG